MEKSELPIEHIEKINFAVKQGLGYQHWDLIGLLSGGLTGIPVYQITVEKKIYAIKLENTADKNFDLARSYKILETVSGQGISPPVYFTDAKCGIILMKYIEAKPRPEISVTSINKFAELLRNLHNKNSFSKWKSASEVFNEICQKLPADYLNNSIISNCIKKALEMEKVLFDVNDIRSCHCDLNPVNVLFDGNNYLLVDWQAASPQSFYFDLAYSATWFYFYNEDLCKLFLNSYLEREATQEEKRKFYLMRVFVNIYLGIGFISIPLKTNQYFSVIANDVIDQLPPFHEFLQLIGSGKINLSDSLTQQKFGFVFLKYANYLFLNS
jgi:tRNA A-37 threonylcarbamoyl transferase component Bud32